MDPVTMVVSALVGGLLAGLSSVAEKAVGELFEAFKVRLRAKVADKPDAAQALAAVESKPESQPRQAVLKEELEHLEIPKDSELLELAQEVLKHADPAGVAAGKYAVLISGGQGITVGDHANVKQVFNAPPPEPRPDK